jgi:hypothetical protein
MPDFLLVTDDGPVIVDVHRWAQLQWPTVGECLLITPDPAIVQWGEITALGNECKRYNLPCLLSTVPFRIGESGRQFSGCTRSQRLPFPSSLPNWSSLLNHSSAVLILLG